MRFSAAKNSFCGNLRAQRLGAVGFQGGLNILTIRGCVSLHLRTVFSESQPSRNGGIVGCSIPAGKSSAGLRRQFSKPFDYNLLIGDYSTFTPILVIVRAGPSNGAVTTPRISLPCLTTTMARFINPPGLGTI
jgi:hypothetical protein